MVRSSFLEQISALQESQLLIFRVFAWLTNAVRRWQCVCQAIGNRAVSMQCSFHVDCSYPLLGDLDVVLVDPTRHDILFTELYYPYSRSILEDSPLIRCRVFPVGLCQRTELYQPLSRVSVFVFAKLSLRAERGHRSPTIPTGRSFQRSTLGPNLVSFATLSWVAFFCEGNQGFCTAAKIVFSVRGQRSPRS